jgi:hypothetical protein
VRRDGESPSQSLTRLITNDDLARKIFEAHQMLQRRGLTAVGADGEIGKAIRKSLHPGRELENQPGDEEPAGGNNSDDDENDGPSFSELVDQHQQQFPKLSRSASIDRVMATTAGRKSMAIEKRVRLRKSLAY